MESSFLRARNTSWNRSSTRKHRRHTKKPSHGGIITRWPINCS